MTLVTLDVALAMPPSLCRKSLACSEFLSEQMRAGGTSSHFELGRPFPGESAGECAPHVSLFMLTVDESEVADVTQAVERLAKTQPALSAEAVEYRHNPYGALEIHFSGSAGWSALQRAVIASVEPLRRGRLRDVDPFGTCIRDLIDTAPKEDPRRRQLLRYGYDEVAEDSNIGHDRFSPHVTLTWPRNPNFRIASQGLPKAGEFSGLLTELAVFGMSAYGTCTRKYGMFSLGAARLATAPSMASPGQ